MKVKSWSFAGTMFLSAGVAGYALWAYGSGVQRVPVHPDMIAVFNQHRVLITVHAVAASIALLLGPLQFIDTLRARSPRLHRALGYAYLVPGVAVGGIAGLMLARHSFGGLVSHLGFGCLAVLWLLTGALAILAAKAGRFSDHRVWMTRNFALTLAAVTLRLYLPLSAVSGLAFESFYPAVAWLCWVPNLVIVEWWTLPRATARSHS